MPGNPEHPASRERAAQPAVEALHALDELQSAIGLTTRSAPAVDGGGPSRAPGLDAAAKDERSVTLRRR